MLTEQHHEPAASAIPRLVDDLGIWTFYPASAQGAPVYIVGSIIVDRYITVPGSKLPAVRAFIEQLDGRQSLAQAHERMIRERGIDMDVEALYRKFARAGLVAGQSESTAGDLATASVQLTPLPIDRLLQLTRTVSFLGWPLVWLGVALIVTALSLLGLDPGLRRIAMEIVGAPFSLPGNAATVVCIGALAVAAHEFSHCYAASCCGVTSGSVTARLYLGVIPIIGLKLTGLYTLSRRGRLAVWGAGLFFNLAAASASLLALRAVNPQSAVLQTIAAINWMLVVFNLMPLLPTDGYFLLSTLLRESNVRVRAWNWLRRPLSPLRRPSLFVLAYITATVWLLASTLVHLLGGIARAAYGNPMWRSALPAAALVLFLVTLWRAFRRTEESD